MPRDLSKSLQRSLTHLLPPPKKGGQHGSPIPTHFRTKSPFVQVKDRIPFWNFAPGDRVVLVKGSGELKGKSGTIDSVERESNRVYLKEAEFKVKKRAPPEYPGAVFDPNYTGTDTTVYAPRPFHVSNLRLQIELNNKFYTATRIVRGAPTWDRKYRRFMWKRGGIFTELAESGNERGLVDIPWVREEVVPPSKTLKANEYQGPPTTGSGATPWFPSLPSLKTLTLSPSDFTQLIPKSIVPEMEVSPIDLSKGYWSRANMTKRFNERKEEARVYGNGVRKIAVREREEKRRNRRAEEEREVLIV